VWAAPVTGGPAGVVEVVGKGVEQQQPHFVILFKPSRLTKLELREHWYHEMVAEMFQVGFERHGE
jgi:hypothetical protein